MLLGELQEVSTYVLCSQLLLELWLLQYTVHQLVKDNMLISARSLYTRYTGS